MGVLVNDKSAASLVVGCDSALAVRGAIFGLIAGSVAGVASASCVISDNSADVETSDVSSTGIAVDVDSVVYPAVAKSVDAENP
jgi:hypothetical protein